MSNSILSEINLQQIINFVTVVEQGGFFAASEELHMTQAAISRSIIRLEETLGIPLFVSEQKGSRSFRSSHLTEQGQYLYKHWRPALKDIEQAWEELSINEVARKALNIAYTYTANPALYFWPVVNKVMESNPAFTFNIQAGIRHTLISELNAGRYDLVVVPDIEFYQINTDFMKCRYLDISPTMVIVSEKNPLYRKESLTIEDISNESFFMFKDGKNDTSQKVMSRFLLENDITPPIKIVQSDSINLGNVYLHNDALTLIDTYYHLDESVHARKIPLEGYYNGMLAVWMKNSRKGAYISEFLKFVPDLSKKKAGRKPMVIGI